MVTVLQIWIGHRKLGLFSGASMEPEIYALFSAAYQKLLLVFGGQPISAENISGHRK